jgi:hypothetical protein
MADAEAPTRAKTVYIVNRSPNTQVVSDVGMAWAGFGETYEDYVRAVSQEMVDGSMGLQRLLSLGTFEIVEKDEMVDELLKQGERREEADRKASGNVIFEGDMMEEITPDGANPTGGTELSRSTHTVRADRPSGGSTEADESQLVEGPVEN